MATLIAADVATFGSVHSSCHWVELDATLLVEDSLPFALHATLFGGARRRRGSESEEPTLLPRGHAPTAPEGLHLASSCLRCGFEHEALRQDKQMGSDTNLPYLEVPLT